MGAYARSLALSLTLSRHERSLSGCSSSSSKPSRNAQRGSRESALANFSYTRQLQGDLSMKKAQKKVCALTPGGCSSSSSSSWRSLPVERWDGEVAVHGTLPSWLDGMYLRNGPGQFEIGDHELKHLFDGYATIVRLHFKEGRLRVAFAQLQSEAFKSAKRLGRPVFKEFAEEPNQDSLLLYLGDLAKLAFGTSLTDNANVSVVRLGDKRVLCLTETIKGSIQINPHTLDTLGRFEYDDKEGGILHTAHPFVNDKEFINVIPNLVNSSYTIVRMKAGTNTRNVLGRVKCRGKGVGWVHSFSVTKNYIVVPEMSLKYSKINFLERKPSQWYKFDWEPHSKAFIHVLDRNTGKEITTLEVPPFFTFHFINAYENVDEESGKVHIIADCCEYMGKPDILKHLELDVLRQESNKTLPNSRLARLIIPLDESSKGEFVTAIPQGYHGQSLDMPTINPLYSTQKYQYVYACGAHRPTKILNTLTKVDLVNKTNLNWYEEGGIPSEPFFVPRPRATSEDDGVILSIINDNKGGSFVVVFDGPSFVELARAPLPHGLPYGFHGCWIANEM